MKKKYIAMVALAGWIGVTAWLASMVIVKPAVLFLGNNLDESTEAAQLRAAVQRNKAVLEVAGKLRAPAPATTGADLIALPRQTVSSPVLEGGMDALGDLDSGPASPTRLSLIIRARGVTSAIVDGERVQVGSRLPGGVRVTAIGDTWLRLRHVDGSVQTLKLPGIAGGAPAGARQ